MRFRFGFFRRFVNPPFLNAADVFPLQLQGSVSCQIVFNDVLGGLLHRDTFLKLTKPVQHDVDLERRLLGRSRFGWSLHNEKGFAVLCDVVRTALGVFDRDRQGFRFADSESGFGLDIDKLEASAGSKNKLLSVVRPDGAVALNLLSRSYTSLRWAGMAERKR